MILRRYTPAEKSLWDRFVQYSRNGTFLFERAYMDYHADRFPDHSLMYFDQKGNVIAILPACERYENSAKTISSHAGLTFGGFVLAKSVKAVSVFELFEETKKYLVAQGFSVWIYKSIPYIYNIAPSQEDEYVLWQTGAKQIACGLSTTIDLRSSMHIAPDLERLRRRRKAENVGLEVEETDDLSQLWPIVENVLRGKYGVAPVHSVEEISLLHQRFPKHIRCFVAKLYEDVLGGVVVYESQQVAHVQYAEASEFGRSQGALDFIYLYLIDYYSKQRSDIRYFDFGISTEDNGRYLNRQLIFYKEDFGGRGTTYKTFSIEL